MKGKQRVELSVVEVVAYICRMVVVMTPGILQVCLPCALLILQPVVSDIESCDGKCSRCVHGIGGMSPRGHGGMSISTHKYGGFLRCRESYD